MSKYKTLEASIITVGHGTHVNAISIDNKHPLAYPFYKYKESHRESHLNLYHPVFWDKVNNPSPEVTACLEEMIALWVRDGVLMLAHDRPDLPSHADLIREYLCFELRQRGLYKEPAKVVEPEQVKKPVFARTKPNGRVNSRPQENPRRGVLTPYNLVRGR